MKKYLKHKILNLIDIKELTAIEYLNFDGKYSGYIEKHDFWELCFVEKGEIKLTVEDNSHLLSENSLILIPPNKSHSYYSKNGNLSRVFVICFQCFSQALRPLAEVELDLKSEACNYMKNIITESLATFRMNEDELLEVTLTPPIGGQQMIILLLECLIINLLRRFSSKESSGIVFISEDNFYKNLIDTIIVFLRNNINKKLTLDEICTKFSCSKSFLCKIFKIQTGDTIISFFNRLKVEEAKRLLAENSQTITAISGSLGYQEVKYFDYIFKKYVGVSPAAFREAKNKGEMNK